MTAPMSRRKKRKKGLGTRHDLEESRKNLDHATSRKSGSQSWTFLSPAALKNAAPIVTISWMCVHLMPPPGQRHHLDNKEQDALMNISRANQHAWTYMSCLELHAAAFIISHPCMINRDLWKLSSAGPSSVRASK